MSKFFHKRNENLPSASAMPVPLAPTMTDDELLAGALQLEQSERFKKEEEEAKKAREPPRIHPIFSSFKSPVKNSTNELKDLLAPTSKKRPIDDDVVPIDAPTVVRPPVKRLPQAKADFHSFAPKERKSRRIERKCHRCRLETVDQRTKAMLDNLRRQPQRVVNSHSVQIMAEEQLRLREKLMRKPKEEKGFSSSSSRPKRNVELLVLLAEETKPIAPVKRKANPTENNAPKKVRSVGKNFFLNGKTIDPIGLI